MVRFPNSSGKKSAQDGIGQPGIAFLIGGATPRRRISA
jgi:hypothetical protein